MPATFNTRRARNQLRKRGYSSEAIAQWLRLHDRATFAKDYIRDAHGKPWEPRAYQRASLQSFAKRKVHCDGRDVGKTAEIMLIAAWASVAMPNREMLIATQTENHLFPLMHRVAERFKKSPNSHPAWSK